MDARAKLAKAVTEHVIKHRAPPQTPLSSSPDLGTQRACYVYLHQKPGQRLRAMFGAPLPRFRTLLEEITNNTIQAIVSCDRSKIRRADLGSLIYRVAVLEPLQRISHPAQLDPHQAGIYITSDKGKTAIILPGRPGITTPQDQIATALREAGVRERQETVAMYRFDVAYYE